ncbi:MAG: hypothetical protein EPN30_05850 [Actinomycetota bacterium]|nr:MAG: hypothetical protein EPN30_05850 [Actinomycetota bacterium]
MPTSAIEEWRYSDIDDLDLSRYSVFGGTSAPAELDSALASPILEANPNALIIKTQNGIIDPSFAPPKGISLEATDPEDISHDFSAADVFSYINVLLANPVTITIGADHDASRPVVVIRYLDAREAAVFPNLCLKLETNVKAQVVEILASPPDADLLAIPITKIFQEDDSELDYLLVQDLGPGCVMIGHQASRLMSKAKLRSMSIVGGGSYSRLFTTSTIAGPGADSNLNAAYFGSRRQVLDFRTLQEHSARNGRSELYFKGAGANESHLVYSGLIKVDKGAISTDAFQTNKNLVLSEGARADSVPNLDIQENDVRCSHASAVGPIDEDQQYYLESRGIRPEIVQRLIVAGFFAEMADRSEIAGVKNILTELSARKWKEFQS